MREEDKPFICYKSGWSMKIVPRNAAGWWALAAWLAVLAPIVGLFIWSMSGHPPPGKAAAFSVAYGLAMLAWIVAMIRWMMARSEMVDMNELLALKRELEEQKRRGRR